MCSLYVSSLIFAICCILVNGSVDVQSTQRYQDTVIRAQCQARCLQLYGSLNVPVEYEASGMFQPLSCASDHVHCSQCMAACNHELSTLKKCKQSCDVRPCRESCSFMFKLRRRVYRDNDVVRSEVNDLSVTSPELHCQGVSLTTHADAPSYIYVRWNVLNVTSQQPAFDLPLVFVISTSAGVLGKSSSNLIPIEQLQLNSTYKLYVTAVSPHGIINEMKSGNLIQTLEGWKPAQAPINATVDNLQVVDGSLSADIKWLPDSSVSSCFYRVYWMSADSNSHGFKKLSAPLPEWKYHVDDLNFGENYTVKIYAYDRHVTPEYESFAHSTWFQTPDCLTAMDNNLTICAPPAVASLDYLTSSYYNNTASGHVTWSPLNISTEDFYYLLEWRKTPPMFAVATEPHHGNMTLSSNVSNVTVYDLHKNNLYKFYITAVSMGGASPVTSLEVSVGPDTMSHLAYTSNNDASIQEPTEEMSNSHIYMLSILSILVIVPVAMYISYKRNTGKMDIPFDMSMNELNYLMDDSMGDLEMEFSSLILGEELGSGAFGRVVKATVGSDSTLPDGLQSGMTVAVKTLKEFSSREDECNFIKEMRLMKHLGRHPCVVSMLACCTKPPTTCIIMDFCSNGDLRSYLKNLRLKKCPYTNADYADTVRGMLSSVSITRSDLLDKTHEELEEYVPLLISYARQIAFGMEYLAQRKFVHRDLAARNVLVSDDGVVKISDFGLTRDIYENSIYQKVGGGKLPVKWMALESIFDQTYTTQSDVWSFGIVLWEIVTLGGSPYPGINSADLLCLLKDGQRMEKPDNCSDVIYELMLACWHPDPEERPSFTTLVRKLEAMMEDSTNYMDLHLENNTAYYQTDSDGTKPTSLTNSVDKCLSGMVHKTQFPGFASLNALNLSGDSNLSSPTSRYTPLVKTPTLKTTLCKLKSISDPTIHESIFLDQTSLLSTSEYMV